MSKLAFVRETAADLEVVVVEDDPDEQLLIAAAAVELGVSTRIEFVDDGQELLDVLGDRPESGLPDLVIVDLRQPIVDGHEALLALSQHENLWRVPTLAWTAGASAAEAERCWREGAVWTEPKPDTFEGYIDLVRSLATRCESLRAAIALTVDWDEVLIHTFAEQLDGQ